MIAVVDSGVANLASVMAALQRLGAEAAVTSEASVIEKADRVLLPGVGAAAAAMDHLRAKNLIEVLRGLTQPVLGICLGMQLLFTKSEEGNAPGLGIIPGEVKRLSAAQGRPVPHMGWNTIRLKNPGHPLLQGVADGGFAYFVHSYAVPAADAALAICDYGGDFAAIAAHKNFFGCQFHPERSGVMGGRIIENFLGL